VELELLVEFPVQLGAAEEIRESTEPAHISILLLLDDIPIASYRRVAYIHPNVKPKV
jgi:hypothetical protein